MSTSRLPNTALADLADQRGRVLTLAQMASFGVSRSERRANLAGGRWRALPGHGIVTHLGPLDGESAWWRAVTVLGPQARLGGITALQADGLTGFDERTIHVWVPKSTYAGPLEGVRLHETRRWTSEDAAAGGVPRSRPAVATVQAALWAPTARSSQLRLVVPIQQRLVRVPDVMEVFTRIKRHRFRMMLRDTLADIADGAQSLGELDFTRLCRQHGIPEPSRQSVRTTRQGRIYLDVYWEDFKVALEINGAGHLRPDQVSQDEIRSLDLQTSGDATAQLSVLTLRTSPEPFFRSLRDLLASRGWTRSPG
ncbi:MAG: hypothetical protein ABI243_10605 [Lapillicoccus sp.]